MPDTAGGYTRQLHKREWNYGYKLMPTNYIELPSFTGLAIIRSCFPFFPSNINSHIFPFQVGRTGNTIHSPVTSDYHLKTRLLISFTWLILPLYSFPSQIVTSLHNVCRPYLELWSHRVRKIRKRTIKIEKQLTEVLNHENGERHVLTLARYMDTDEPIMWKVRYQ
jgi:hypothetical protein